MSDNKNLPWWLPLWLMIAIPLQAIFEMLGGKTGKAEETHPSDEKKDAK